MKASRLLLPALVAFLFAAPPLLAAGENLVFNPSFAEKGDGKDPIPSWIIRSTFGRTGFSVKSGRLFASRDEAGGLVTDRCFQDVNLPPDTKAILVSVTVGTKRASSVEIVLDFVDRTGRPVASRVLFRPGENERERTFERDLPVPAGTRDVRIAFDIKGPGEATFDDVVIKALPPDEVRGEVRLVRFEGHLWVEPTNPDDPLFVVLPLPASTGTQSPVSLAAETSPPGRIRQATWDREQDRSALRLSLDPAAGKTGITIRGTTLLTELEGFRDLPAELEIVPSQRFSGRVKVWLEDAAESVPPAVRSAKDLRALARAVAAEIRGSEVFVPRAAGLFRARDVPARPIALLVPGKGIRYGVEAYQAEAGWLRFGLDPQQPGPTSFLEGIRLERVRSEGDPATPAPGPGVTSGQRERSGGETPVWRVEEIDVLPLPRGAAGDLVGSFATVWESALRRMEAKEGGLEISTGLPALRGKARRLKADLARILEES